MNTAINNSAIGATLSAFVSATRRRDRPSSSRSSPSPPSPVPSPAPAPASPRRRRVISSVIASIDLATSSAARLLASSATAASSRVASPSIASFVIAASRSRVVGLTARGREAANDDSGRQRRSTPSPVATFAPELGVISREYDPARARARRDRHASIDRVASRRVAAHQTRGARRSPSSAGDETKHHGAG